MIEPEYRNDFEERKDYFLILLVIFCKNKSLSARCIVI